MFWHAPNMWLGGVCWLIGGGPSLPRQFGVPEDLIKKVMNRKERPDAYSPYLAPIHNKHIIAVNNAYQLGAWIDVVFFGDCGWYLVHRKKLANFPGLKVTCCSRFLKKTKEQSEGIKYLEKDSSHRQGIGNDKSKVSWNSNSGAAAINLAIHFGVKQINLLGFDMKVDVNKISHWHGSHVQAGEKPPNPPFAKHLRAFPIIAQEAQNLGVKILNVCPESSIDVFPKVDVKELL